MAEFRRSFKSGQQTKESSFDSNTVSHYNVVKDTQKLNAMEDDVSSQSSFSAFCYDSKSKEFFGRSAGSCCKLLAFMFSFSCILAAFWGLCLWVFYQTLDNYTPKLTSGHSSFIGTNPGLGFRPMRTDTNPYSSLIWFRHGAGGNWDDLKDNLDNFLAEYEPGYYANAGNTQTNCDFDRGPLREDEACEFNKEWLSDEGTDKKCISEEKYGYLHGKPCLMLKLNRVYGWYPEPYYNMTEVERHPTMPKSLKTTIRKTWEDNCKGTQKSEKCPQLNMVWLHCDGEDAPDKENIGTVTYTPWRGFPGYYFPYWNQLGYLQPVVMVQLRNPTPAILTNIECTAWARNIEHDRKKRRGSVHIEFLMD